MSVEHRIVVGVDGTRSGENALRWAADFAAETNRSLMLVHVGDGAGDIRRGDDPLGAAQAFVADKHADVTALAVGVVGEPAIELVRLAHGADLLVLGRGREGFLPLRLGRVAHRALSRAVCPTAVVPCGPRGHANAIAVGVSDSIGGAAALRFAFAEAARLGAQIIAVRSWSAAERRLGASAVLSLTATETGESQERTVLSDCLLPLRRAYPTVAARTVLTGEPSEIVLEREGENALMVVVGCRRADGGRLPRLGPVASWAVRDFDVPVVVVGHPVNHVERGAPEDWYGKLLATQPGTQR
jgi:nucleotide-binding universal stress UspA family protein